MPSQSSSDIPTKQEIQIYFSQKGIPKREADAFITDYTQTALTRLNAARWKRFAYRRIRIILASNPWLYNRHYH